MFILKMVEKFTQFLKSQNQSKNTTHCNQKCLKTIGKCPMFDSTWTAASFDLTKTLTEMVKLSGENFLFDIEANLDPENEKPV